jgi:hypothetical protein
MISDEDNVYIGHCVWKLTELYIRYLCPQGQSINQHLHTDFYSICSKICSKKPHKLVQWSFISLHKSPAHMYVQKFLAQKPQDWHSPPSVLLRYSFLFLKLKLIFKKKRSDDVITIKEKSDYTRWMKKHGPPHCFQHWQTHWFHCNNSQWPYHISTCIRCICIFRSTIWNKLYLIHKLH